jgi:hypothetical protein
LGVKLRGKPKGSRSVRGLQARGKAGRVNNRESSLMLRNQMALGRLGVLGFQGPCR